MALTYAQYVTTMANMVVVDESDANFLQILPSAIDYAEDRIYRELNLLAATAREQATLTPNTRYVTLPTPSAGRYVTLRNVNVFVGGVRSQLTPCSIEILDFLYPREAESAPSVPTLYAMLTDQNIVIGPPPDQGYTIEYVGTIRPTALSASNTTTMLSLYLADLLVAASMIFMSGYQRNFGAQADDPKMSASWESQYVALRGSAATEEVRKKYNETFVGSITRPSTSGGTT